MCPGNLHLVEEAPTAQWQMDANHSSMNPMHYQQEKNCTSMHTCICLMHCMIASCLWHDAQAKDHIDCNNAPCRWVSWKGFPTPHVKWWILLCTAMQDAMTHWQKLNFWWCSRILEMIPDSTSKVMNLAEHCHTRPWKWFLVPRVKWWCLLNTAMQDAMTHWQNAWSQKQAYLQKKVFTNKHEDWIILLNNETQEAMTHWHKYLKMQNHLGNDSQPHT